MSAFSSPLFFIILMIIGGGVSAYLADMLGFKIGKKRLSVLRIRPKYVARIAVTIAGCLIPFVTISLMSASSQDFRDWLIRGREAIAELQSTVKERDRVQSELIANRKKLASMENQSRLQAGLYRKTVADIADQDKKLEVQRQRIADQERRVRTLDRQVRTVESENFKTRNALKVETVKLVAEKRALVVLKKERIALERRKTVTEQELESARIEAQDIKARNLQLDQENQSLVINLKTIQAQLKEFTEETASLKLQRDDSIRLTEEAKQQLADLEKGVLEVRAERDRYEAAAQILRKEVDSYRQTPLTYVALEEVSRTMVPAQLGEQDAKNIATTLLRQARVAAERRGAKSASTERPDESIRPALVRTGDRTVQVTSPEQLWPLFANLPQTSVVVASSAFNFFQGEPVLLQFSRYNNPIVLKVGEIVAESRIDGTRPEGVIYNQVAEFLVTKVNARARRERMVARRVGYEDSYGEVEPDDLLSIVRQIQQANRVVRLQAFAREDMRAGDRLTLYLRIK